MSVLCMVTRFPIDMTQKLNRMELCKRYRISHFDFDILKIISLSYQPDIKMKTIN